MNWAAKCWPATGELVKRLLIEKQHPEQGYRSCLGLMRLARSYGRERMEAACTRALAIWYASLSFGGVDFKERVGSPARRSNRRKPNCLYRATPTNVVRIITTNPRRDSRC